MSLDFLKILSAVPTNEAEQITRRIIRREEPEPNGETEGINYARMTRLPNLTFWFMGDASHKKELE